jgi:cyanophycinase
VDAVGVLALARPSAAEDSVAALVAGAGLIYLSGGDPRYVTETLRDTRTWAAIAGAWRAGAALAGCSAGAMALGGLVAGMRRIHDGLIEGLGAVPGVCVLPHFDRLRRWRPQAAEALASRLPPATTLVGIDEETAMVSEDGRCWRVHGRRSVWVYAPGGAPLERPSGSVLEI